MFPRSGRAENRSTCYWPWDELQYRITDRRWKRFGICLDQTLSVSAWWSQSNTWSCREGSFLIDPNHVRSLWLSCQNSILATDGNVLSHCTLTHQYTGNSSLPSCLQMKRIQTHVDHTTASICYEPWRHEPITLQYDKWACKLTYGNWPCNHRNLAKFVRYLGWS